MFSFFKNKDSRGDRPIITTDIHSHLLAGIDDGVKTIAESIEIIKKFQELGYNKLITTPHIFPDFFNNTPEIIGAKLSELKDALAEQNIDVQIEAAAEYYLDESFIEQIENGNELLTFGNNYLLFETGFMNEPINLKEIIFKLKSNGYNPVMAHPERYGYLANNFELVEDLINRGVYMQLNINSISGYYSPEIKKMAEKLIDSKQVHFIGSDCHTYRHVEVLLDTRSKKYYNKALSLDLLNNSL